MWGPADTPLRVLLVDDPANTTASLALIVRSWAHEVRIAHDGPSALAVARDFHAEVILLDVDLPHADAFDVARQFRCLPDFGRTYIVAASHSHREEDRCRAVEAGIDLYLPKPFDPWELEQIFMSCCTPSSAVSA